MKCVPFLHGPCVLWILVLISSIHCKQGSESGKKLQMTPEQRIINGTDAKVGDYPHQVFVRMSSFFRKSICGGTIISDEFVLLAAHCVIAIRSDDVLEKLVRIEIFPGLVNISILLEAHLEDAVPILVPVPDNVFIHPCYGLSNASDISQDYNDIALVKTASKIPLNFFTIKKIQIDEQDLAIKGTQGIVIGWGNTISGVISTPLILQQAQLEIDTEICLNENSTGGILKFSEESQICAHRDHVFACHGDSGGPLLCKNARGQNVVCGVASLVLKGTEEICSGPTIFARVYYYRNWIKDILQGNEDSNEGCDRVPEFPPPNTTATENDFFERGQQLSQERVKNSASHFIRPDSVIYGICLFGVSISSFSMTFF